MQSHLDFLKNAVYQTPNIESQKGRIVCIQIYLEWDRKASSPIWNVNWVQKGTSWDTGKASLLAAEIIVSDAKAKNMSNFHCTSFSKCFSPHLSKLLKNH